MQTQTNAPHFETLTRALADKIGSEVNEQDLLEEFEKYLEYGVPPDQAVKTILRHHGVQGGPTAPVAAPSGDGPVPLQDVPANVPHVDLLVRVVTKNIKTVQARGEEKQIIWGLLGDASGTVEYTSWRPLEGIEKGDCIAVQGAYTKEFRNQVQVNFGDRCRIEKAEPDAVPRVPTQHREVRIGELEEGMRGLKVTGRILDVQAREVTVQGEPKTIFGGTLADTTGKVEFTSWHDHGLKADEQVAIGGGYIRSYRGVPQLNFDQDAEVERVQAELPAAEELDRAQNSTLGEIVERGGGNDVSVVATLLEVRPGSGLVFRCPEEGCNRVLAGGQCRLHGKGEGTPDLRIKGVLDDGTGAVNVIVGREITETVLGKDVDQALAEAREAFRHEVVQEQLEEKVQGRVFRVRGNVLSDEYGPMFLARSLEPFHEEKQKAAEELIARLPAEAF